MYGDKRWPSALAEALGRERTQIWRYVKNDAVPRIVEIAVTQLLENKRRMDR